MGVPRVLTFVILVATLLAMGQSVSSTPRLQSQAPTDEPALAATFYSQLEVEGRFSELYASMHPDAQAIVPESAVVGWYRDNFALRGPGVITVTGVQMVSWTWGVTGGTYPLTAEVSFTQPFADGSVANDVVRLVEHEGQWRWFFGRSREFVDEQIAVYGDDARDTGIASCAGAAEWWAGTYPRIGSADYAAYTLSTLSFDATNAQILSDYADMFGRLHDMQARSMPPPGAESIQDELLSILETYELALPQLAAAVSGQNNPMAASAVLANNLDAIGLAGFRLANLDVMVGEFLDLCQPIVVFVPTLGGDTPPAAVLPGEPEPAGFMPVECRLFSTQTAAQRFHDAAGAADPYGLDRDGDGIACEPGE